MLLKKNTNLSVVGFNYIKSNDFYLIKQTFSRNCRNWLLAVSTGGAYCAAFCVFAASN
jgi:hypothetical protein